MTSEELTCACYDVVVVPVIMGFTCIRTLVINILPLNSDATEMSTGVEFCLYSVGL